MAVTAVAEGWERCRSCIEPGTQKGRGDAPEESRGAEAAAAASPESGAAAAPGAGARGAVRSAPPRCAPAQGQAEAHRLRSRSGSRGRPRRELLSLSGAEGMRIERGGLCKRRGHAATCEPPATAGGGGISGPRQEETLGGPRPPARGAHTQAHTHSHPRAHAQPAGSGDRSDANKQVGEVSRRPRPRAPVLAGKRFQNAQGQPWQLRWVRRGARGSGAPRQAGGEAQGGGRGDSSLAGWTQGTPGWPPTLSPGLQTRAVNFPAPLPKLRAPHLSPARARPRYSPACLRRAGGDVSSACLRARSAFSPPGLSQARGRDPRKRKAIDRTPGVGVDERPCYRK